MELWNFLVEKIVEFVGFVFIDEYLLFDENFENMGLLLFLYEINFNNESLFYEYKKRFNEFSFNSFVLILIEIKFFCCDDNFYYLFKLNV